MARAAWRPPFLSARRSPWHAPSTTTWRAASRVELLAPRGSGLVVGSVRPGLLGFPKRHPYATNIVIATVKTSICDILVQKYVEKKERIDWKRNAVFLAFGFLYLGVLQWFVYVTLFKRWFPGMVKFANQPLRKKLRNRQPVMILQNTFSRLVALLFTFHSHRLDFHSCVFLCDSTTGGCVTW